MVLESGVRSFLQTIAITEQIFSLLCIKEAFLAIDPFEYQIKSNWNAVQVGRDSSRLQTP